MESADVAATERTAYRLGIGPRTLTRWRTGASEPSDATLAQRWPELWRAYNTHRRELFECEFAAGRERTA